jgi:hypothetical protein
MNAVWWPSEARQALRRGATWALAVLVAGLTAGPARAAIEDPSGMQVTPPRLGLVEGEVLFWRSGTADWEQAPVNLPVAAGDALATRSGKLELQIGRASFLRAGDGTQLRLKSNEPGFLQFEVSAGVVSADLRDLRHGDIVEIDTANSTVRLDRDGYYRVEAASDSTRLIVRRGGQAQVVPSGGNTAVVATGEAVEISGTAAATLSAAAVPAFDEWDRWNYSRAERALATPRSYAVSEDVYGVDDLEQYGSWRYTPTYGRVWVPTSVPVGWAPYTYGRWVSDPLYGWTWVDYAPWGWAPYHYGRWVYAGYWGWAPGPVLAVPVYAPALVAFFGSPYISIGIGVPAVSWVALGWGEPLVPWWGPVGFIGHPCWYGWGGPRVVNNIVINNGDVVHANAINLYRNTTVPGALVSVPKDRFDSRALERVRLAGTAQRDLQPIHGPLPVASRAGAGLGSASKLPLPAFDRQRAGADAQRELTRSGLASSLSRVTAAPFAGAKTASAAFDRLHGAGPAIAPHGALTAPLSSGNHTPDLSRGTAGAESGRMAPALPRVGGAGPPPLAEPAKAANAAAFQTMRGSAAGGSSPPPLRESNFHRGVSTSMASNAGARTGAESFQRLQTSPYRQYQGSGGGADFRRSEPSHMAAPPALPRSTSGWSGARVYGGGTTMHGPAAQASSAGFSRAEVAAPGGISRGGTSGISHGGASSGGSAGSGMHAGTMSGAGHSGFAGHVGGFGLGGRGR